LGLHPEIDVGQSSLQRLLVALRLVIRDIAAETNRMRDAADGAAEGSDALRRVAVTASDRIDAAVEILAARRDGLPAVTGSTSDPQVAPPLRLERDGLAGALTAFRMLMREIKGDADALRSCLQQLSTVGATPAPFDLAPLVADLRDRLEAGNAVLADVHAQVSRQGAHAARDPDVSAAPLLPSLGQTIGLMSAFTAAMENRFTDLEARIAEVAVRCSSGDARENLSDLVQALYAAGGDLRRDMSEFLAVGAALTKEVESVAPRGGLVRPVPNRRSARPA
jgi:hypothetical protein